MRAQEILDDFGITGVSAKDIKKEFELLSEEQQKRLVDEVGMSLMGFSYRIGNHAYNDGPREEGADLRGNGMALLKLLELLKPNHPFVK